MGNNRTGEDFLDAEKKPDFLESLRNRIIGSEFNEKGGDFLGVQRNKRLKNMLDNI
jgi:hypothetical protein